MGYWSVFTSTDFMDDHCNYVLPLSVEQAMVALEQALARPGRVECQRASETELTVLTVMHTPAWTWVVLWPWLLLFVRKTRRARATVAASGNRAVVSVRGTLDTAAASRIRALAVESGRDVVPA